MILNIFKEFFRDKRLITEDFSFYDFVTALVDIMQILAKNLFEFTCDTSKSELIKSLLERPINRKSNVLDEVMLIKKEINDICDKK